MTPTLRRKEILNMVRREKRVYVDELAERLHISRETVRRDLSELARACKVQKFHGGAELPGTHGENRFQERMAENVLAKVSIAAKAFSLVTPGETIFIDTGSTTLYFAEKLTEHSGLTIVTNSTEIARILSSNGNNADSTQVFLLGGQYHADNRQTAGNMVIDQLGLFRAHHAILTIGALDERSGIMDFNIHEAQVARAMINQAESLTVLADSSKFGRIASFEVCGFDRITNLVCDVMPDNAITQRLQEAGVNLLISSS